MCIIAAKPAGVDMPDETALQAMWSANSDGAGFMYAKNGAVHIEKGFMKLKQLKKALARLGTDDQLKALPIVMHFRITTAGGTTPENTHPFPVADSLGLLQKLRHTCPLGVAHNGCISISHAKNVSDTMEYIKTQLAPLRRAVPRFYMNPDLQLLVENATGSKLAFLDEKGHIYTIGGFNECDGLLYSNYSYLPYSRYPQSKFSDYGAWVNWADFGTKSQSNSFASTTVAADYETEALPLPEENSRYLHCYFSETLMPLDEVLGEYVRDAQSGELLDPEGLAINFDGAVYYYDYDIGAFIYAEDFVALNSEGLPLAFDETRAYDECVFDDALLDE